VEPALLRSIFTNSTKRWRSIYHIQVSHIKLPPVHLQLHWQWVYTLSTDSQISPSEASFEQTRNIGVLIVFQWPYLSHLAKFTLVNLGGRRGCVWTAQFDRVLVQAGCAVSSGITRIIATRLSTCMLSWELRMRLSWHLRHYHRPSAWYLTSACRDNFKFMSRLYNQPKRDGWIEYNRQFYCDLMLDETTWGWFRAAESFNSVYLHSWLHHGPIQLT